MTLFTHFKRPAIWVCASLAMVVVQGCATAPGGNPSDPFESFNRSVFSFNDGLDRAVIKPVATVYRDVTPSPIRTGVTNFFGNLQDAWSVVNNALQGKGEYAGDSLGRVMINTVFGLGGLLDMAGEANIPKHTEDFGQTLGVWGVPAGPYLVLPALGSSTVRDSAALIVDFQGDAVSSLNNVPVRNTLQVTRAVNLRANLLGAGNLLDEAALDIYLRPRRRLPQRTANKSVWR
jgi:phospholipid-binding lipoprotein MlaA